MISATRDFLREVKRFARVYEKAARDSHPDPLKLAECRGVFLSLRKSMQVLQRLLERGERGDEEIVSQLADEKGDLKRIREYIALFQRAFEEPLDILSATWIEDDSALVSHFEPPLEWARAPKDLPRKQADEKRESNRKLAEKTAQDRWRYFTAPTRSSGRDLVTEDGKTSVVPGEPWRTTFLRQDRRFRSWFAGLVGIARKPFRTKRGDVPGWLGSAMVTVQNSPCLSDAEIARQVGVHKSTLSRNSMYQAAAALARDTANKGRPRGFKAKNGDVVAFEDSSDPDE